MKHIVEIEELGDFMQRAQSGLSRERMDIVGQNSLSGKVDREEYTFAYLRAEQFGLKVIKRSLKEVEWLPLKLDPDTEMLASNRKAMKIWLKGEGPNQPTAENFGNDFMHALARSALAHGWDDIRVAQLAARIARLFLDLSCLVGIAYYSAWIAESRIDHVKLSNPADLHQTAVELAEFLRTSGPKVITPAKEQDKPSSKKHGNPPFLHVVKSEEDSNE